MRLAIVLPCLVACSTSAIDRTPAGRDAGPAPDVAAPPPDAGAPDAGAPDASAPDAAEPQDATTYGPYAEDGPETFSTMEVEVEHQPRGFTVHVHLPDSATPHAIVLLQPGSQQPASSYTIYARRLASHGIAVFSRDDPGILVNTQVVVDGLVHLATDWLPAQNDDPASPFHGRLDLGRLGVAGHSRGAKATLLAAEGDLRGIARAYFALDAVDVTFIDDGIYAQTNAADVDIPTTFIHASVESNCSPANASGELLHGLVPSPSVFIVAIGAGHMDFEDPCVACNVCRPGGTADPAVVREYSVRYLTAFFARELLGDTTVGAAFEGAGAARDLAEGLIELRAK